MKLDVGDRAPAFTLVSDSGRKVKLTDYKGKRVLLYFYPAAMTPGCTKQACDFRDNLKVLERSGFTVIGISPDQPEKLATFKSTERLTFPLLADPEHSVMEKYGAWGEKSLYGKKVTGVIRSTFVISPSGTIEHAWYNVKATGHVAKIMRELDVT